MRPNTPPKPPKENRLKQSKSNRPTQAKIEAGARAEANIEIKTRTEVEAKVEGEAKTRAKIRVKAKTKVEVKTEAEVKTKAKIEAKPEIEALVFDFGGVISKTLFETHDATEASLGLPKGSLTWRGPFSPDCDEDPLWQAMQRREMSERDYWQARAQQVGALVGQDWTSMKDFVQAARGQADPEGWIRPEATATIAEAKARGLRLAILSNELDLFYGEAFSKNLPLLQDFEVLVDATYTNILKPDPRAFALVAAGLDLPLSRCLFIDDQLKNIEGAQALGMPFVAFDVTDPRGSYDRVRAHFP